jgi:thioredoxin-like negative regulator of GroEL
MEWLAIKAQITRAEGFLELGDPAEAFRILNDFPPKIRQTNYPVLFARLKVLDVMENWVELEKLARSLSRCLPDSAKAWFALAIALTQLQRLSEAKEALKTACSLDVSFQQSAIEDDRLLALW